MIPTKTEILMRRKELHDQFLKEYTFPDDDANIDWDFTNWIIEKMLREEIELI